MTADFTSEGYRQLIASLVALGYKIKNYDAVQAAQRHLVLRHDIDQSLEAAAALAALEAAEGWRASYFVLMRSEMYNPFSPAGARALEEISNHGHEIGLHLDAALYGGDIAALEAAAAHECAMLESITGQKVAMISFHRPAPELIPCAQRLAGRGNTYEPRFFNEIGYCSDSRGAWHHGHPREHDLVKTGQALQLLTHAIWWMGAGAAPKDKLTGFVEQRVSLLESELAAHCAVYTPRQSKEKT